MDPITEQLPHAGGFIVSEAPGTLSREAIVLEEDAVNGDLKAGTVLLQKANGKYIAYSAEYTPEPTVAAILFAPVDATAGDANGVAVVRLAEVRASDLIWVDEDGDTDGLVDLASTFIIAR
jgi:hypothetical protein